MASLTELTEIIGFFSYSREDDRDSDGALSVLRRRIQNEMRGLLGRSEQELRLWQDQEAIPPGTLWEGQIGGAIEQSVFFIPIITPRVINSRYCQIEFDRFLEREAALKRNDLIFPILYIEIPELRDERQWREHPVLKAIGARQYVDWCDYRFDLDNPNVRRAIAAFCRTIVTALRRAVPDPRAEEEARVARQREDEQARRRAEEARQLAEEQAARDREATATRQRADEQAARDREATAMRQRADEQAARDREATATRQRADEQAARDREATATRQRADEQAARDREAAAARQWAEEEAANAAREAEHLARERAEEQRRREAAAAAAGAEQGAAPKPAAPLPIEPLLLSQSLIGLLLIMQGVMGGNSTLVTDIHAEQIITGFDDVLYHLSPLFSLLVGIRFIGVLPAPIARILPLIWLALAAGLLGLYYCVDAAIANEFGFGGLDAVAMVISFLGMAALAFAARKTSLSPGKLGLIAVGAVWIWSALLFLLPGLFKSPYFIDAYIGLVTFPLVIAWAVIMWRKGRPVAKEA